MRLKIKSGSQRYDINWPWTRHGHKYTKYKMCLSIMMVVCIKQHLSNIWSSIHDKVKQHWGWVEKKALLIKKRACEELKFYVLWHIKSYSAQHSWGFLNEGKVLTRSKMRVWQISFFNPLMPSGNKKVTHT